MKNVARALPERCPTVPRTWISLFPGRILFPERFPNVPRLFPERSPRWGNFSKKSFFLALFQYFVSGKVVVQRNFRKFSRFRLRKSCGPTKFRKFFEISEWRFVVWRNSFPPHDFDLISENSCEKQKSCVIVKYIEIIPVDHIWSLNVCAWVLRVCCFYNIVYYNIICAEEHILD